MKITLTQFRPNTAEAVWTDCFAQAIAELHKAGGGVLTVPTGEYSTGPNPAFPLSMPRTWP